MLGVGRRRTRREQRLEPFVVVGSDPPLDVGLDDDHVVGTDRVLGLALSDDAGSRADADRDVTAGRVNRNELSRLEVAEHDLHPVAPEHGSRAESILVVRPFAVEVGCWHG